jgi:ABC-type glutathione transport system ATPase component
MPRFSVVRDCQVQRSPRVMQVEGMFDVPPSGRSEERWEGEFDLPQDWNVGLIVGPSGCGKSTLARELFGDHLVTGWEWPAEKSLLDGFPKSVGIKDLTGLLSSVGFSSPPLWLRPFAVLSTGQQFRVNVARTLAEKPDRAVID